MIVIRRGLTLILQCLIGVITLIFMGASPVLFSNLTLNFRDYFQAVYQVLVRLFTLKPFTLDGTNSLFPVIFERYFDSMRILGLGMIVAYFTAFLLAYLAVLLFKKRRKYLKKFLEMAEAIPDLMFLLLLQMMVIVVYKKTGIRLAHVVTVREKAILLPVISIAIPISFYITKVLLHQIEGEFEKNYILLAKSKGLTFLNILNIHIVRNIIDGMFVTSKTIIWSMLSTLLVIDYLFNMNGLLRLMVTGQDAFIIGCILIFIPIFIIYRVYEWLSFDRRKDTH